MVLYLLDTNICIYIRKARPANVLARFRNLAFGDAVLSVISFGELAFGVEKSPDAVGSRSRLMALIERVPVVPLPAEAGSVYGAIRADLQRSGTTIGNNDLWIAAHAVAADLVLVTNNEREFSRIPALKTENWTR